jgi:SPP1 family predicted phage head-tail adaptor
MNVISLLNNTVIIYTVVESISTVTGENIKTETSIGTFKVRISPLSQNEQYYASKNNLNTTHKMYCQYSTVFDAGDRVVIGTSTFEIAGITNPSLWNKFLQVDLKNVS